MNPKHLLSKMQIMVLFVCFTGLLWASESVHRGSAELATVLPVC